MLGLNLNIAIGCKNVCIGNNCKDEKENNKIIRENNIILEVKKYFPHANILCDYIYTD